MRNPLFALVFGLSVAFALMGCSSTHISSRHAVNYAGSAKSIVVLIGTGKIGQAYFGNYSGDTFVNSFDYCGISARIQHVFIQDKSAINSAFAAAMRNLLAMRHASGTPDAALLLAPKSYDYSAVGVESTAEAVRFVDLSTGAVVWKAVVSQDVNGISDSHKPGHTFSDIVVSRMSRDGVVHGCAFPS